MLRRFLSTNHNIEIYILSIALFIVIFNSYFAYAEKNTLSSDDNKNAANEQIDAFNSDQILNILKQTKNYSFIEDDYLKRTFDEGIALIYKDLLQSISKDKQAIRKLLLSGKIDQAIEQLEILNKKQKDDESSIAIKLELAILLSFDDPNKSLNLLKENIAINPSHLQTQTFYGLLLMQINQARQAISVFEHILENIDQNTDYQIINLSSLANAYFYLEQFQKSIDCRNQLLKISQDTKDRKLQAKCMTNLGIAHYYLRKFEESIFYYHKALKISEEIGDRLIQENNFGNLGNTYIDLGQINKAIDYYKKALKISQETKNQKKQGIWLGNLGVAYADLGEIDKAKKYLQDAINVFKNTDLKNANIALNMLKAITTSEEF